MSNKIEKPRYEKIKYMVSMCNHEIEMNPGTDREVLNKYFKRLNNDEEKALFYLSWIISDEEFLKLANKFKTQGELAKYLKWNRSMVATKIFAINKYYEYEKGERKL